MVVQDGQDDQDAVEPAVNDLMIQVYDELHRLAHLLMAHERNNHTLQPTALVSEAYLNLAKYDGFACTTQNEFRLIAARALRRVLIDHARTKNTQKRGGSRYQITLNTSMPIASGMDSVDLIELSEALDTLEQLNEQQARIVELRFFAGFTISEIAEIMNTSTRTIDRHWRFARVWLRKELSQGVE